jgi:hypothetical protein
MIKIQHNTSFPLPHSDQYMHGYELGCSTRATRRMHTRHRIEANAFFAISLPFLPLATRRSSLNTKHITLNLPTLNLASSPVVDDTWTAPNFKDYMQPIHRYIAHTTRHLTTTLSPSQCDRYYQHPYLTRLEDDGTAWTALIKRIEKTFIPDHLQPQSPILTRLRHPLQVASTITGLYFGLSTV